MTYPDPTVAAIVGEHFVPLMVNIRQQPDLLQRYQAFWTPSVCVIAQDGTLVYRNEGWMPAPEFATMLILARGYYFYRRKRHNQAALVFNEMVTRYPRSPFAPEAQYMLGVCIYLSTGSSEEQEEAWRMLLQWYPASLWATKARGI
ncbi:MAG: hypothetical protein HYU29_06440 [Chloroflexi bacterium]|nr:hypothetical protein [Chloroflexota bacterium]